MLDIHLHTSVEFSNATTLEHVHAALNCWRIEKSASACMICCDRILHVCRDVRLQRVERVLPHYQLMPLI